MALVPFWILLGLMFLGMPVVFALLFAPGAAMVIADIDRYWMMLEQRVFNGMNTFTLMAVPFFILAGEVMNRGNITVRLVDFSRALIGHLRGGLAHVNIFSSILFAGMSGSAVADTSALGTMLIPAMEKNGYSRRFAAAVTAASSVIGPIIPPSGILVIYAVVMEISVGGLFAAGIVPGVMVGAGLMAVTWYLAKKRNYPVANEKATFKERMVATRYAFWPLLTPIILLGGILSGFFTPTEAAAVAAGYAFFISLFVLRTLSFKDVPIVLWKAAMTSGVILLLIAAAVAFAAVLAPPPFRTATTMGNFVTSISSDPYLMLFCINLLLFVVGMFLDAGPAILILGPILGPPLAAMGIEPMHFAIVMCVNLTVGLATPPMGLVLFVAASITGERVEAIAKEMLPFLAVHVTVILLITYIPALTMTVPRLLGFA